MEHGGCSANQSSIDCLPSFGIKEMYGIEPERKGQVRPGIDPLSAVTLGNELHPLNIDVQMGFPTQRFDNLNFAASGPFSILAWPLAGEKGSTAFGADAKDHLLAIGKRGGLSFFRNRNVQVLRQNDLDSIRGTQ